MINLKDIVNGQKQAEQVKYNTDLFKSDVEYHEEGTFNIKDYETIVQLETKREERKQGTQSFDVLIDTFIGTIGTDAFLVTVEQSSFNGEPRISHNTKELTLAGFNYFTKEEEPNEDFYNLMLNDKGYELTVQDILSLGELNTDYNSTTLKFKHEDNTHYLTVNQKGQLSKITVKEPQGQTVQAKQRTDEDKVALQSVFGELGNED